MMISKLRLYLGGKQEDVDTNIIFTIPTPKIQAEWKWRLFCTFFPFDYEVD